MAALSGNGKWMVTANQSGRVRIFEVHSGRTAAILPGSVSNVWSVQFDEKGQKLLVQYGYQDQLFCQVWKLAPVPDGTLLPESQGNFPTRRATFARFAPGGRWLIAGGGGSPLLAWDLENPEIGSEPSWQRQPHKEPKLNDVWDTAFMRGPEHEDWVVTGWPDGVIRIHDLATGTPVAELKGHQKQIYQLTVSPDGKMIASGSLDKTARVWQQSEESETGFVERHVLDHSSRVKCLAFRSDSRVLATGTSDGLALIWDLASGARQGVPCQHGNQIRSLHFSPLPDDLRFITASEDQTARIWDSESGFPLSEPLRHDSLCVFATFTPDGQRVITTGDDGLAQVWEAPPFAGKLPDWMLDWSEAAVGQKIEDDGTPSSLSWEDRTERRKLLGNRNGNDRLIQLAEWFDREPSERKLTPFSEVSRQEAIANRINEGTALGLRDAAKASLDQRDRLISLIEKLKDAEGPTEEAYQKRLEAWVDHTSFLLGIPGVNRDFLDKKKLLLEGPN